jgi:hypothetical protein
VAPINDAIRFLLELAGIAAAAYWGYRTAGEGPPGVALAVVASGILIVFWGLVVAPRAVNPIAPTARVLIGSTALLLTAAGLYVAGQTTFALVFAALIIVNTALFLTLSR